MDEPQDCYAKGSPVNSRLEFAESKMTLKTAPYSPLNLREKLGLKDASGLEWLRDLSPEEEAFLGEVDQDVTDDLTQVHPTDHFLKPESRGREGDKQEDHSPSGPVTPGPMTAPLRV